MYQGTAKDNKPRRAYIMKESTASYIASRFQQRFLDQATIKNRISDLEACKPTITGDNFALGRIEGEINGLNEKLADLKPDSDADLGLIAVLGGKELAKRFADDLNARIEADIASHDLQAEYDEAEFDDADDDVLDAIDDKITAQKKAANEITDRIYQNRMDLLDTLIANA